MIKTDENSHHQRRGDPYKGELSGAKRFDEKRPAGRLELIKSQDNQKKIERQKGGPQTDGPQQWKLGLAFGQGWRNIILHLKNIPL
jgi:hypothetical protein